MTGPAPRKRGQRPPPPPAPPRAVVELVERVERHLTELAEVHRQSEALAAAVCVECMLAWPCHTRVMLDEAIEAVRAR